jgi:hypothetical protein
MITQTGNVLVAWDPHTLAKVLELTLRHHEAYLNRRDGGVCWYEGIECTVSVDKIEGVLTVDYSVTNGGTVEPRIAHVPFGKVGDLISAVIWSGSPRSRLDAFRCDHPMEVSQ